MQQGLNFQTHQYVDPSTQLQQSLGAGGMFAQTLKGMQQFDDDNVKIDMMRHEQARQAKIDAQNDAAIALSAKEKAYNMGAEKAVNDTQVRADLGNLMYQKGLTGPEQAMLVNQSDSQINATNAGAKVSDALAGIDRTKLNADQQKRYDQLASADGNLNTTSDNGKDTYNVATKLGLLKDAYALGGIGETDAYNKAAKTLGISNDSEQGVIKSNNEENAFVNRYTNLAAIDPLFGQTKLDKLADYQAEWVKLHPEDKDFMTSAVNGLQSSLNAANGAAIAERKKELDTLLAQKAALGDNVKNADLDNSIKMAQMRITAAGHEESSENGLAKAIAGLASGGSNLSREDKFSINLADQLRQYATSSKPEVGQNIIDAYRQAKEKGYSAAETRALVQGGIHADGIPEKNQGQAYKFDNKAMFDKGPSKAYTDSNDYVAIRQQQIATNDAQKEAEFAQLQKLLAAKGGSSGLAALDKQIYDVQRTPQEAYTQAAMQAGKDFAYDEDLAGHKGIADAQAIADQAAMNKFHADAVGGTPPSAGTSTGKTTTDTGVKVPTSGSAFELAKNFITQGEGHGFKVYMDHEFKDGKTIDRPATYLGVAVSDANSAIDQYNTANKTKIPYVGTNIGYAPTPDQTKIISSFADNHMKQSMDMAYKYVGDTGNKDTNDLLAAGSANMLHQYGDNSEVAKRLIAKVVDSVKSGNGDEAIKTIMKSSYGDAYSDRALAFASAVKAIPGLNTTINPESLITKYDAKTAAARYSATAAGLKKSGLSVDDQNQVLANLQNRFKADHINLDYKIDPLGFTSPTNVMQKDTDKNRIIDLTSQINSIAPHAVVPIKQLQVVEHDERPLATWLSNLPTRYENMVAENTNDINKANDDKLKYRLNSERNQLVNAAKSKDDESAMLIADAGLAAQYKNATTSTQKKLIIATAEQFKKDKENAERGAALKAGIFQ
jgi:hypothetical protein